MTCTYTAAACLLFCLPFIFCISQWITSCTVSCPAFNDTNFKAWFPYQPGQHLMFVNPGGVRDSFMIGTVKYSDAYSYNGAKQICYIAGNILSVDTTAAHHFSIIENNSDVVSVQLWLKDFDAYGSIVDDTGIRDVNTQSAKRIFSQFYTTYNLKGRSYDSVQLLTYADSTALPASGISTVYLSKKTGIIGYKIFPAQELWIVR